MDFNKCDFICNGLITVITSKFSLSVGQRISPLCVSCMSPNVYRVPAPSGQQAVLAMARRKTGSNNQASSAGYGGLKLKQGWPNWARQRIEFVALYFENS